MIIYYGYKKTPQENQGRRTVEKEMIDLRKCDVGSEEDVPATVIGSLVSYIIPVGLMIVITIDSARILLDLNRNDRKRRAGSSPEFNPNGSENGGYDTGNQNSGSATNGIREEDDKPSAPAQHANRNRTYSRRTLSMLSIRSMQPNEIQWSATFIILLCIAFVINVLPFGVLAIN